MPRYLEIPANDKRDLNWDALHSVENVLDNTYDAAYSEHFITHLYKYQGISFLKEIYRVLKPGGLIRIVWTPYEFISKLVSDRPLSTDEETFVEGYYHFYILQEKHSPSGYHNKSKREQCALGLLHKKGQQLCMWTKQEMIDELDNIGFVKIKEHIYRESRSDKFENIDIYGKVRRVHSAVIEAEKPLLPGTTRPW